MDTQGMAINHVFLYQQVGERLKQRRAEMRLTQTQLSERVGVLRTSITNIEAGRQHPPLHLLYALCQVLGLEVTEVLPTIAEVVQPTSVFVEIDGKMQQIPPKTARLLQELIEGEGN
jgi:transcriptional regulator with XRE-family HTH domain